MWQQPATRVGSSRQSVAFRVQASRLARWASFCEATPFGAPGRLPALSAWSITGRRSEAVVSLLDQRGHVQAGAIVVLAPDDLNADREAVRQPNWCHG